MEFKKVNRKDIPGIRVRNQNLQSMIEQFMNSDMDIVEVEYSQNEYKNVNTCCAAWRCAVKRSKRRLRVFQRGEHIYLEKLSI